MEGLANLAELPKRLEDLKKRLQDESEEAEKRRRRQQGCPRILSAACGAAMVAIGAAFDKECVGNGATIFLMVGGSVTIFGSAMKVLAWLAPPRFSGKIDAVANLSDFAFFVIAIWGSVEVFGAYANWESDDATSAMYCPATAFLTAFVGLICFWVLLPLCCIGLCCIACTACWCACCCVRCCAKESEVGTIA